MTATATTLATLRTALDSGTTTSVELVRRACAAGRRHAPMFITLDETAALRRAAELDATPVNAPGALRGIPIAVKDVIDTAGLLTTMASEHFREHVPDSDAAVVSAFTRAGAIVVGKTNAQEFSYGIRGDQGAFGRVPNPHDAGRLAGGSSSGSAAAVARGIVPLAIGTDTAGSVRVPAALCGVVGFKPTYGRIDDSGVFPLSPSFDTLGFMAPTVRDIADAMAAAALLPDVPGAAAAGGTLRMGALAELRASVQEEVVGLPHDLLAEGLGLKPMTLPRVNGDAVDFAGLYNVVRSREAFLLHKDLLSAAPELYQPYVRARLQAGAAVHDEDVAAAQGAIAAARSGFLEHFADVDILVSPTVPVLAPDATDERPEVGASLMAHSVIWNVLGWPAVTVPYRVPGLALPQSVQLIGKPGEDAKVLAAAAIAEAILQGRQ